MMTVRITTDHAPMKALGMVAKMFVAVIAGEPRRQRIAEKGVGPFILGSAEASHHEGRVGNILDHLRHGAPIAHALASAA